MRVDLFTLTHKGVRALLFELAGAAATVDVSSTAAVDALVAALERTLELLDEHARHEDTYVIPELRALEPALADELVAEHRALEAVQNAVERAAEKLALATLPHRAETGAVLVRAINRLVAVQLLHMNREETDANAVLWAGRHDADLVVIREAIVRSMPRARRAEWLAIITPALNPVERGLVGGTPVE